MPESTIFVISDLHIGDHGPTDNFSYESDRPQQLRQFLDYVEQENGELIVVGDLFEFWQANISKVVMENLSLLDRLAELDMTFVHGNHDADLRHFTGTDMLNHAFFEKMSGPLERTIGGRKMVFIHGHEVDPFNCGDDPGWGRILTIFAAIFERINKSPMLDTGQSVEEMLTEFGVISLRFWNWAVNRCRKAVSGGKSPSPKGELTPAQNPARRDEMLKAYRAYRDLNGHDVLIAGHTHQGGRIGDWYFNSGSWVGADNEFIRIEPTGNVQLLKWTNDGPMANDKELADA